MHSRTRLLGRGLMGLALLAACQTNNDTDELGATRQSVINPILRAPRLDISPVSAELVRATDADSAGKKRVPITLTLATAFADLAAAGATKPVVSVEAGEGVEVNCAADGETSASGFSSTCTLPAWTYVKEGATYRARTKIWARLAARTTSTGPWQLTMRSDHVSNGNVGVSLVLPRAMREQLGQTFDGVYEGELRLARASLVEPQLDSVELIRDAGFEGQTTREMRAPWIGDGPDGWDFDCSGGFMCENVPSPTKGNHRGEKYQHSGANNAWIASNGWAVGTYGFHQDVAVQPGTPYRASAWLRSSGRLFNASLGVRRSDGTVLRRVPLQTHEKYSRVVIDFETTIETGVQLFFELYGNPPWEAYSAVMIDDVSLKKRLPPPAGELVLPVKAFARGDGLMLVEPTRQLSPAGRIFLNWRKDEVFVEPWIVPRSDDSGSYAVRVRHDGGADDDATLGKLAGTFVVALPTNPVTQQNWGYKLSRTGVLPENGCGTGCAAGETCDMRIQVCVAGPAVPPAAPPGNTLEQAQFDTAGQLVDQAVLAAAPSFDIQKIFDVYHVDRTVQSDYRFTTVDLVGLDIIKGSVKSGPFADLGYHLCQRDWASQMEGWGDMLEPRGGFCEGYDDGISPRSYCDKLYWNRNYRFSFTGSLGSLRCRITNPTPEEQADLRRNYIPCLVPPATYDTRIAFKPGTMCNSLYSRAMNAGVAWKSEADWLAQSCKRPEENHRRVQGDGKTWDTYQVYLCPLWEPIFGGTSSEEIVERTACYRADGGGNTLYSAKFGGEIGLRSGDLVCRNSKPASFIDAFVARDSGAAPAEVAALVTTCMDELGAALASGGNLGQLLGDRGCINQVRFLAEVRTMTMQPGPLLGRLLQSWVELHTLIATQRRTAYKASSVINGADKRQAGDPPAVTIDDIVLVLDRMERGWNLVLDASVSDALAAMPADALLRPDYRRRTSTGLHARPEDEQVVGLPMTLLEGLTSHLALLNVYLGDAAAKAYLACAAGEVSPLVESARERLGSTLRYVAAVEALASQLLAGPLANGGVPDWMLRYEQARRELAGAREVSLAAGRTLNECQNPLGFDESAVPLYFVDPVGENARYFAASDFLFGEADKAVRDAKNTFGDARTAWLQSARDEVQKKMEVRERDIRIDDIKRGYGRQIIERCGMSQDALIVVDLFDPEKGGKFTAENCHIRRDRSECLAGGAEGNKECFRGQIGEAFLMVEGARQDVELARSSFNDQVETIDKRTNFCINLHKQLDEDGRIMDAHRDRMRSLRDVKAGLDIAATMLEAAAKCGGIEEVFKFGAGCSLNMGAGVVKSISIEYGRVMEEAEMDHKDFMQKRANMREAERCFHEADLAKVGLDTANAQIQRRMTDAQLQLLRVSNLQDQVRQLVAEARATIAREEGRTLLSFGHHYWFDEHVRLFETQMTWARKATYLAVAAAQYDYQLRFDDGKLLAKVAAATHPDQLTTALLALAPLRSTRRVNGARPSEIAHTRSLGKDLLGIFASDVPTGEERAALIAHLMDEESAIYDQNGMYIGQGVRFTLDERSITRRCGERLWRLTAMVIGPTPIWNRVPLLMMQRNVFQSQRCGSRNDGEHYQVGAEGARSVFGELRFGNDQAYSDALLMATVSGTGIERDDFKNISYTHGSSEELAARGLYGEYLLVFPWEGLLEDGFDFSTLEDVLLRFDFLSVSNNNQ